MYHPYQVTSNQVSQFCLSASWFGRRRQQLLNKDDGVSLPVTLEYLLHTSKGKQPSRPDWKPRDRV